MTPYNDTHRSPATTVIMFHTQKHKKNHCRHEVLFAHGRAWYHILYSPRSCIPSWWTPDLPRTPDLGLHTRSWHRFQHQTSVCTLALDIGSNMTRPKLFYHSPWSPRRGNDPSGLEHVTVGVQRVSRQNLVAACVPSSSVQNRRFDATFYFYYHGTY